MSHIIYKVRKELIQNADEKTKASADRYFKEKVKIYGLKSADVSRISKENYNAIGDKSKKHIFSLCNGLWQSGYMEESFIACNWSYNVRKQYEPADFDIFEIWVNDYIENWASCDTLCNHTVGTFVEMYPEYISALKNGHILKTAGSNVLRRCPL